VSERRKCVRQVHRILIAVVVFVVAITTIPMQPARGQSKLVFAFIPSAQTEVVLSSGERIGRMLSVALGIPVDAVVTTSYAAAIEAMCAGRADIGALNPFGYVLARDRTPPCAEVALVSVRFGLPYYRAQFNVRTDAKINSIAELKGKRFAYVDAASTSGFLFPRAEVKKLGFDPDRFFAETVFAGSHPNVILAVYRGQVDGGATFEDARSTIQRQFPDVLEKVKVIATTNPIPNDTFSINPKLSPDLRAKIKDRLLRISQTAEGKDAFKSLYDISGLTDTIELTDQQVQALGIRFPSEIAERIVRKGDKVSVPLGDWFFQPVRDAAKFLGLDLQKQAK